MDHLHPCTVFSGPIYKAMVSVLHQAPSFSTANLMVRMHGTPQDILQIDSGPLVKKVQEPLILSHFKQQK